MTVALRYALLLLPFLMTNAQAEEIKISSSDCRWLQAYEPGGADYQPGVAADGTPVPPADLTPPMDIGKTLVITLKVDLMKELGISSASPLLDPEAHLGVITVQGDRVFFNGRALGTAETRYVARECLEKQGQE